MLSKYNYKMQNTEIYYITDLYIMIHIYNKPECYNWDN